jgi:hypothetical protein
VKNAPAVTARRATNQIVLVAEHQALAATAAETLAVIVLVVIVLAEQTVRVVTMRLIDHAATATGPIRRARLVTASGHIRRARPVTAIRARVATAMIVHAFRVATAIHRPGHHVRVATAPTRLALLAMVIHVLVAMAIRAAGPHVAMVILLVALRVLVETAPIRRAPRATARAQTVLVAIGRIVRVRIALTATSRAVSGSPMGESVVRSARR